MSNAETWHNAMRRARTLHPDRIASRIYASADTGLRAQRFDAQGGRTTRVPCRDGCEDGEPDTHSHLTVSDPTGNAATRGTPNDRSSYDLANLERARRDFIHHAGIVLDFVKGQRPTTWAAVVLLDARLLPGTIQSGIDVDGEGHLYGAINRVAKAVEQVGSLAKTHDARDPSQDEKHWTSGLAPADCCAWHLEVHDRYRRPRVGGTNVCADCLGLSELLGRKPPRWLVEAMIDHGHRPIAWRASLGRAMDELGIARSA